MPCNSAPTPHFSREDMDAVEIYFKAEIDRVTRVACEAIKALKRNALYDSLSDEARAWSHEHDAWDAARTLIEKSVRVTIRRDTFDDEGNEIDYGDDRHALSDDDVSDLQIGERMGTGGEVDQELSRQVYDDMLDEQEDGDDILEAELRDDAFVHNIEAQVKDAN
jgi:hypothetical protein